MTDDTADDDGTEVSGRTDDGKTGRDAPGVIGDGGDESMEEMSLAELREEIQSIDRELVELIARRTYVADTIADVKRRKGLPTTDEEQEQAVMNRAGENAERFEVDSNLVKAIFRLLIELNKVEQRERR
jgi:chorismate mutase